MDSLRTTDFGRRALSYSLEGMAPRDEMLFKSLVRLLDHLTVQKWIYRPPSADHRADLLVVAEHYPPTVYRHPQTAMQPVLSIGKGAHGEMSMTWPLHPLHLQATLDRLGSAAIVHQANDAQTPFVPVPTRGDGHATQLFRLKQWPPTNYLAGVGRMRLATLLTGRAMSLQELQQRSALSLAVCRAFVADLQKGQLVVVTSVEAPATITVVQPHELLDLPSASVAFAKPGLLARIRAGLGIKSTRSA